ncbi:MAG: sugar transferase [Lentisphaerae bacterium]|nr:sugar transferase [Lentisphaerota bacterium]
MKRACGRYGGRLKRAVDVLAAAIIILLFWPLGLALAALVWAMLGRPALFKQTRAGLAGRPFTLYKFRTMTDAGGEKGAVSDAERMTGFGRFMRATSLDELPEVVNVLRGDMSLVGPRPLLMEYLPLYSAEQARRHEVRPGLTGWAQVNGRNALDWEERFRLDVWYVDHHSLLLDARILCMTVWRVLSGVGIVAKGCATMPRFTGTGGSQTGKQ